MSFRIGGSEQSFTVQPEFGLPGQSWIPGNTTTPFAGPFNFRPVVGERYYTGPGSPPANDPVQCGNSMFTRSTQGNYNVICVDDPSQATLATDIQQVTRDVTLVAGPPVAGQAGTIATVPFQFKFAGTAAPTFTLNAGAVIPGGTAAVPSPVYFTPPDNSTTTIPVGVGIPAGTPPGTYKVILAADLPNLEWRAVEAQLNVIPAPGPQRETAPIPPPTTCRVPDVRGQTKSAAIVLLRNAGCALGTVTNRRSSLPSGQIVGEFPYPGTNVALGTKVAIHISTGRHRRRG
jgi:hypothetical protein